MATHKHDSSFLRLLIPILATGAACGLITWGAFGAEQETHRRDIDKNTAAIEALERKQEQLIRHSDYQSAVLHRLADKLDVRTPPPPPPVGDRR